LQANPFAWSAHFKGWPAICDRPKSREKHEETRLHST
jgi:hypothetical protein